LTFWLAGLETTDLERTELCSLQVSAVICAYFNIVSPELVSTRSYLFALVISDLLYFVFTFIRFVILILLVRMMMMMMMIIKFQPQEISLVVHRALTSTWPVSNAVLLLCVGAARL